MQIGDRYLNHGMMVKAFIFIGIAIVIFISPSAWPSAAYMLIVIMLFLFLPGEILFIFHARCPRCKKFLTAQKLGSEPIGSKWVSKERATYSCVNCGEKWTRDKWWLDYNPHR